MTAADVEMADATRPGPSIQSLVDRAVSAKVKELEKKVDKVRSSLSLLWFFAR